MIGEEQEKNIKLRILTTAKYFLDNPTISDVELAKVLVDNEIKTSSTTVGRDLTSNILLKELGEKEFKKIQEFRSINKINGLQRGGKTSQEKNYFTKDETGKFTGMIKK